MKIKNIITWGIRNSLLCLIMLYGKEGLSYSSHTTLIPRRISQNSVVELALHNYYHLNIPPCNECPSWITAEVTAPYFFKSTKGHDVARYFLPCGKESIIIGENNTSDVAASWLQLLTPSGDTFMSRYAICPTQEIIGGAVKLFFDLGWCIPDNWFCSNLWASVFIPIQQVRHNLHIQETPLLAALGEVPGIATATQALDNPSWLYGKLSPKSLRKSGVDDIALKVGMDLWCQPCGYNSIYGLLFVPTGKGPRAHYLFEPLVGSNHWGAGVGFNGEWQLLENGVSNVTCMADIRYAYLFKHHEFRSFDLFNGDWSRYMLVAQPSNPGLPLPGINFLTKKVEVTPRSMLEVWLAASLNYCDWHLEVGYDFWYRSKEKVRLAQLDLGVGILDIGFDPAVSCPLSSHCATITSAIPNQVNAPASDQTFITIKNSVAADQMNSCPTNNECCAPSLNPAQCSFINVDSAAAPRALSNTLYAAVSYSTCVCDQPALIGIGGSYEIAARRGTLSEYGIWLKSAISF